MVSLTALKIGQKIKYKYLLHYHYKIINLYDDKQPLIDLQEIDYQGNGPLPNQWKIKWTNWQNKNNGIQMVTKFMRNELVLPKELIDGFWEIISVDCKDSETWSGNPETEDNIVKIKYITEHYKAILNDIIWKFYIIPDNIVEGGCNLQDILIASADSDVFLPV